MAYIDKIWEVLDTYLFLASILGIGTLVLLVYAVVNKKKEVWKHSEFIIPLFICLSLGGSVWLCNYLLPWEMPQKDKMIHEPKAYPVEPREAFEFNSDTLDKYYLDAPRHDSLLSCGLEEADENEMLAFETYYLDKLDVVTDPRYKDIAYWGLGIVQYYGQSDECLKYFALVKDRELFKLNYYLGYYYLAQDRAKKSEQYLTKEFEQTKNPSHKFVNNYFALLLENKSMEQAAKVYDIYNEILRTSLRHDFYIYAFKPVTYVWKEAKYFVTNIDLKNILISLLIIFTWFYFLYFSDLFQKEKFKYVFFVVAVESILVFLCPFIYDYIKMQHGWSISGESSLWEKFLYAVGCIGLVEESIKAIPFLLLLLFFEEPDDSYDYLFYICVSSLTFSFVENSIYFDNSQDFGVYNGRALFSTIGHLYDSSLVAYGFMFAKFQKEVRYKLPTILLYCCLGVLSHGVYDFFIFSKWTILFYLGYFMSIVIWIVLLNNSLNNSHYFSFKFENKFKTIQLMIGINLTIVLILEYVFNALKNGVGPANDKLVFQLLIYGLVISFFIGRLAKYDLVKGYWRGIAFLRGHNYERHRYNPYNLLSYIDNFFLFNRVVPKNYVGEGVKFESPSTAYLKNNIYKSWAYPLVGKIIDRRILRKSAINGVSASVLDPNWFVLELDTPDDLPGYLLFKFVRDHDVLLHDRAKDVIIYAPTESVYMQNEILDLSDFEFVGIGGILRVVNELT